MQFQTNWEAILVSVLTAYIREEVVSVLFFWAKGFSVHFHSGSSCSLAAGLESLGLTDIRTLVRLMCLAAAGRAGLSTSPSTVSSSTERSRGIHSKTSKPISCLAYLSTAVGCLASNTPSAAKLLVQLCTQVGVQHLPETTSIICAFTFSTGVRLPWLWGSP